jgi:RNA-binding protein YhbY
LQGLRQDCDSVKKHVNFFILKELSEMLAESQIVKVAVYRRSHEKKSPSAQKVVANRSIRY